MRELKELDMSISLPAEFSELQPFAENWARATEYERAAQRRGSTPAQLQSFYDTAVKHLPQILERIDRYPLNEIQGEDVHLFRIAMSLAEVAPHVEFYDCDPKVPFAFREDRMLGYHSGIPD
jgi:hypothetical protein